MPWQTDFIFPYSAVIACQITSCFFMSLLFLFFFSFCVSLSLLVCVRVCVLWGVDRDMLWIWLASLSLSCWHDRVFCPFSPSTHTQTHTFTVHSWSHTSPLRFCHLMMVNIEAGIPHFQLFSSTCIPSLKNILNKILLKKCYSIYAANVKNYGFFYQLYLQVIYTVYE